MKLLLLKILLQRRARDEGFTLPMVIALGLVMILLGAVSITIANEENITAISQNSRSDALAIAELGVARYRELLDRNRILAVNDSSQWTTETQVCNNNINESDNPQDDKVPSLAPGASNSIALLEDGQTLNNDGDTTDSFTIGSYRLVSYDYTNANGEFNMTNDAANNDARGILTVRGTAPDGSEAQIEAEIPIRINLDRKISSSERTNGDITNLAPALWIGNTSPTLGNLTVGNGNVVIKDSAVITGTTRDGCRNFSDTDTTDGSQNLASTVTFPVATPQGTVISDSRNLPPLNKIEQDLTNARNVVNGGDLTNNLPTASGGTVTFGSTTDKAYNPAIEPDKFNTPDPVTGDPRNCANIKLCRYYYDPPETIGLTYTDTHLVSDGIARTTLLLDQDFTLNATTKEIKIGSTSVLSNASDPLSDSDAFEIYVKGNRNITINATQNVTIYGFIHAPDSTLTITGTGTVNIKGSVWVNNFVNSTATVNISPDTITRLPTPDNDKTSGKGYEFYSTTASRTPRPITGSPTNWKTEQVN
jgi:hypothetical protein